MTTLGQHPGSLARAFAAVAAATLVVAAAAHAGEVPPPLAADPPTDAPEISRAPAWQTLGLMRIRDMTPFGLGRLDMLPAHAVPARPRTFAFELNASYQNTWALSDNVRDYLERRAVKRGPLDTEAVAEILALPGEAYLVDGEFGVLDLTLHYRATSHLGVYATVPWFSFRGGFLDATIEAFHEEAGLSSAGREFVPRNGFLALADLARTRAVVNEPPRDAVGDPVLGVRYSLIAEPDRYNIVLEGAVKISVVDRERFVATGRDDFGLQVSLQRFLRRNAFYLSAAGVYYQPPDPGLASDGWIPTVVAGWETKVTRNTNFILQGYASRSSVRDSTLDELSATKIQATLGLQRIYRGHVLRFGITENVANHDNTPDIGFNLSVARILSGTGGVAASPRPD